jgi:hypothetical protein
MTVTDEPALAHGTRPLKRARVDPMCSPEPRPTGSPPQRRP